MNAEIPEFLIEMSKQMRAQPNRGTAHPFWQVRCKRYIVTECGYDEHHWVLCDSDSDGGGEFFRSDNDGLIVAADYLKEYHEEWFLEQVKRAKDDEFWEEMTDQEIFAESFDFDYEDLPAEINRVFVQEVEEIVTTHLTEVGAKQFIKRKQHDYPKLYTHVESAYWSPQLRELQDWIKGLSNE